MARQLFCCDHTISFSQVKNEFVVVEWRQCWSYTPSRGECIIVSRAGIFVNESDMCLYRGWKKFLWWGHNLFCAIVHSRFMDRAMCSCQCPVYWIQYVFVVYKVLVRVSDCKWTIILPKISTFPYPLISALQISLEGVAKQLSQLSPNKACGPDELPACVLKEMSQSASGWLAFIFQQSLNLNMVRSDWSKALITDLFKKDNNLFL